MKDIFYLTIVILTGCWFALHRPEDEEPCNSMSRLVDRHYRQTVFLILCALFGWLLAAAAIFCL